MQALRVQGAEMKNSVSLRIAASCVVVGLGFVAGCGAGAVEREEVSYRQESFSQEELDKIVLGGSDLKGYSVDTFPDMGKVEGEEDVRPAVAPAVCQPISDLAKSTSAPNPVARVVRSVNTSSESDSRGGNVTLLAYAQGVGVELMKDLRESSQKCKAYKQVDAAAYNADITTSDVESLSAPDFGDESLSYKSVRIMPDDGGPIRTPMTFVVVRAGATIAVFTAIRPLEPDKAEVPMDVVKAQLAKLEQ